jgi:hypothetical protein
MMASDVTGTATIGVVALHHYCTTSDTANGAG